MVSGHCRTSTCASVSVPFRGFRGLQGRTLSRSSWHACGNKFQSPSGVLGVCRRADTSVTVAQRPPTRFSPLPGFSGSAGPRPRLRSRPRSFRRFQSPSGVLGVCRRVSRMVAPSASKRFQSPSGVLGVCRLRLRSGVQGHLRGVSVPFRGFRGLQGRQGCGGLISVVE